MMTPTQHLLLHWQNIRKVKDDQEDKMEIDSALGPGLLLPLLPTLFLFSFFPILNV